MFGSVRLCVIGLCLLLGAGCGSDEPFSGFFNVSWGIYDIDTGEALSCDTFGFDTAVVRSYNVDSALWNEKDLFDCDAYSGETYPVAPGLYEITVSLEGPGVLSSETLKKPLKGSSLPHPVPNNKHKPMTHKRTDPNIFINLLISINITAPRKIPNDCDLITHMITGYNLN